MTKIIITFFVIGCLTLISPKREDITIQVPIYKSIVVAKVSNIKKVKSNKITVPIPTDKVVRIAERISSETNIPKEKIIKIIWAESNYNSNAKHINKNHTYDSGLLQINSSHISEAKKMGIDIFTDEGNVRFAIYLIKTCGLSPWDSSKHVWDSIDS